jgi:hypothetical protein
MSGGERRAEAAAEIELEASAMIGNPDRDSSPC